MYKTNIKIDNSPIEFILVGANTNTRDVIVKSSNAGLDLIGAFSIQDIDKGNQYESTHVSNFLSRFSIEMNYHRIKSNDLFEINNSTDSRGAEYWFIWKGIATNEEIKKISDEFNKRVYDIKRSINFNEGNLEWNIAPIITMCSISTNKHIQRIKKRKTNFIIIGSIYLITVITILAKFAAF